MVHLLTASAQKTHDLPKDAKLLRTDYVPQVSEPDLQAEDVQVSWTLKVPGHQILVRRGSLGPNPFGGSIHSAAESMLSQAR